MRFALLSLAAFAIGSIPTAFLFGKFAGVDLREQGSGNVGATNAARVLGKKVGLFVFVLDLLKGFVPAYFFMREMAPWIGAAAILGHIFSPFMRFKGGKGVATGCGVILAAHTALGVAGLLVWAMVFTITRIVSLSSIAAMLAMLVGALILRAEQNQLYFFVFVFLLGVWTHRENIVRLFEGKEGKFS